MAEQFKTTSLNRVAAQDPSALVRMVRVFLHIYQQRVGRDWAYAVRKGSLTLQDPRDAHRVVKVFVDLDNVLAQRTGVSTRDNPVVVGVELEPEVPFITEAARDYLATHFQDHYVDPREPGNDLWALQPIVEHGYDILFVPPGKGCEAPGDVVELLVKLIHEADGVKDTIASGGYGDLFDASGT